MSWKIVPAVTEVWHPQPAHSRSTPRTGHDRPPPQRGQRKPSGHRSRARYARHASSVPNFASNSARFPGYFSTTAAYYILGLPESSGYPPLAFAFLSNRFFPLFAQCYLLGFHLRLLCQSLVPAAFELCRHKPVRRIYRIVLPPSAGPFIVRLL